jgi:signal transduction histidine kinase
MLENSFRHGDGVITVRATESAETVTLHVLDEGGGWDEDFAKHAFDRFATGSDDRAAKGAGLGLAIVAAIAAAHGGAAHAANRDGGGADVWIELPKGRGAEPANRSAAVAQLAPTPVDEAQRNIG